MGHGFSHRLHRTTLPDLLTRRRLGLWLWLSQVKSVRAKSNLAQSRRYDNGCAPGAPATQRGHPIVLLEEDDPKRVL
jgi:hypothetical protein